MIVELRLEDKKLVETLVNAYSDDFEKVVQERIKNILEDDSDKIDKIIKKYLLDDVFIKKCIKEMIKYQTHWIIEHFQDEMEKTL